MTTEAINRERNVASVDDRDERAQLAVRVFRSMQFGLSGYAQAIIGDKDVRVEISSGPPHTDGKIIYYRPPITLGDKTSHDRFSCDKRGSNGLHICAACRVREEVLVNIYHEIAHIAFGTFQSTSDYDRREAVELGINEWGGKYAEKIKTRIETAPYKFKQSYLGLAGLISPFLPYLVNCLEDARVDSSMFRTRKGTRKMLEADTFNLLRDGIPSADGTLKKWDKAPLNSQIALGCYLEAAGYLNWQNFMHPQISEHIADDKVQALLEQIRHARNAADTYNLAFPILTCLREFGYFKLDEPEEEEQQSDEEEGTDQEPLEDFKDDSESDASEGSASGSDGESQGSDDSEDSDQSGGTSGDFEPEESDDAGSDQSEVGDSILSDSGEPSEDASNETGDDGEGTSGSGEDESDEAEDQRGAPSSPGSEPGEDRADEGGEGSSEVPDFGETSDTTSEGEVNGDADQDNLSGTPRGEGETDESKPSDGGSASANSSANETADTGSDRNDQPLERSDRVSDSSESNTDDGDGTTGSDVSSETPEGVLESGADEGKGGVRVEEPAVPTPEYGDENDVKAALSHAHPEPNSGDEVTVSGSGQDKAAVDIAILQGLYFETPSWGVSGVQEHRYSPGEIGWDSRRFNEDQKTFLGIICDMDVPESVLGPALLKTRRIFSDNKTAVFEKNLKSGRINKKVLGRRAWNDDERLFGKKRIPGKRDYAVLIGIDISSSNLGNNLALVKRAALAQAELLSRIGIQFQIVAHSATGSRFAGQSPSYVMHLHHIKDWDEPWNKESQQSMAELVGVGGNLDGHAMEYMRKQLGKVEATDKILLYYTDGKMPAANKEEELQVLQRQIKLCKRDQITLLGVGIRTDSPIRHGLDTVQVDEDNDLKQVVEHLGRRLQRSAR